MLFLLCLRCGQQCCCLRRCCILQVGQFLDFFKFAINKYLLHKLVGSNFCSTALHWEPCCVSNVFIAGKNFIILALRCILLFCISFAFCVASADWHANQNPPFLLSYSFLFFLFHNLLYQYSSISLSFNHGKTLIFYQRTKEIKHPPVSHKSNKKLTIVQLFLVYLT